jgi:hypothetical protein
MSSWLEHAVRLSKEDIEALSNAELVALADVVAEETGAEIVKESDRERALEQQLAEDLDEEYVDGVDEALADELGVAPEVLEADEAVAVVSGVGQRLDADLAGDRGVRMNDLLLAGIGASMLLGRSSGIDALAAAGYSVSGIGASLTMADRAAMEALAGQNMFWIGKLYPEHLSARISATISRDMVATGLGRAEVGRILRGVVTGSYPGVAVPGTWPGSSGGYYHMLAGTVRNQAANFALLETFSEAKVERYMIQAVLDKRTSAICNMMHGRTFTVETGKRIATARVEAETPEDARAASPWLTPAQVENLPGFSETPEAALARAGVAVPPFHGNCRTTIVPA